MANHDSSGLIGDTPESLKAEQEDFEEAIACVRQMTRDFDAMTEQDKSLDVERVAGYLQMTGPHMRIRVWAGIFSPEGFQWHKEAMASQKALGEQMVRDAAAVAEALIAWGEDLERREQQKQRQPQPAGRVTAEERAAEAGKFERLAEMYSEKARDEDQLAGPTALVFDGVGQPDEQDRHKLAAREARDIAEELQHRAYILTHGTEENYRKLVIDQYGISNPELNEIMAYYAKKFNDQATLNWLKLQHPAVPPSADQIRKDVGMMALLPQFEKMGEAAGESPLTGKVPEKSTFDKATDVEKGGEYGDGETGTGEQSQQWQTEEDKAGTDRESGGKGSANENTKKAALKGSSLHSDKPGNLPDQLRDKYPDTGFEFTKPGVKGQDVKVTGGTHPSEYPSSDWKPEADHGDFKPDTPGGTKTFKQDQKAKWIEPTQKLPYDPDTGKLK